jgi:subtilisin family serine protease
VPLRCFSSAQPRADTATLVSAINDAVNLYHCDVINMSWGAPSSETLRKAIDDADDAGVILVAAAGNVGGSFPQGSLVYPAAYDAVVSVASVDKTSTIAPSSIQNRYVTVCAPGKDIPFTNAAGKLTTGSGTSFAAPCVAAALALAKQYARQNEETLQGADCLQLLRDCALDLGAAGWDAAYGWGLVRLDRLFAPAGELPPVTPLSFARAKNVLAATVCCEGSGATALCAFYSAEGRLLGAEARALVAGDNRLSFTTLPDGAAAAKLLVLDAASAPLCPAWELSPEE